jgi:prevent-host-death family protein
MLTMTSLDAQQQFGTLIDASQRQPVTVTRRGRPVAVVLSYEDYQAQANAQTIPWSVAALISETHPLLGKQAGQSMRAHLSHMSSQAERDGLTEADVTRMLNANG